MTDDGMERIGESVRFEQEAMTRAPGTKLPQKIVDAQVELAEKSKLELQELIVHAAVALAIKIGGTATPRRVLEAAVESSGRMTANWDDTAAEVRKALHVAYPERDAV